MSHSGGSVLFTARVVATLALLLPPLWLRLLFERDERVAFQLVRQCARRVLRGIGSRVEVVQSVAIAPGEPVMLVSNHVSIADAAVLLASVPLDFRFVANHVFAGYPLLGAAIRAASANIVDRGSWRSRAESGQAMVDALSAGQSLLVFPEGTTADGGTMLPFRNGPFRAAARTGRPVVPIALHGTRDMMPAGRVLLANAPVSVHVLEPIHPVAPTREAIAELRERTARAIRERLESGKSVGLPRDPLAQE